MKHFLMKFTGILAIVLSFAFSSLASYCACCAEKGYYSISYGKPDDYQIAELESVVFAKRVSRYVDAGDDVMGISTIADTYDFAGSFAKPKWNLTFKTDGKSGNLILPLPTKMVSFKVDTHENDNAESGLGPVLYKEWRFEGTVSGTGIFKTGIAPMTKYFLVFQGRGNLCDSAGDFTDWRLEITGKKASYAFYGKIAG